MRTARALPLLLLFACSNEQTSSSTSLTRDPGECSAIEVHVIGVDNGGDGSTVYLARPGKHMLVLSAHDATTWKVQVSSGATLERVYAVGYYPQKVTANVPTKITTESKSEGGAGANGYMYPDKSTDALLDLVSHRLSLHATSFHGCYSATRWTIGENMLVTSDCQTPTYHQYDAVTDCDGDNECGDGSGSDMGSGGGLY